MCVFDLKYAVIVIARNEAITAPCDCFVPRNDILSLRVRQPCLSENIYGHPKLSRVETPVTGLTPSAFLHIIVT